MKKSAVIGLILIGIMFLSTFAFAAIQSTIFGTQSSQQVQLPQSHILTSELTSQQASYLLQQGYTIVVFKYNITCLDCQNVKSFLEQATQSSDFKQQIYLEELAGFPLSVQMSSARGSQTLTNVTQSAIVDAFCNILIQPPVSCALRKV
jgi:outer membrane lipoprotein-sorting protein